MILLCGIPSEPPVAMVQTALEELGIPFLVFNQRRFDDMHLRFRLEGDQVAGEIAVDGREVSLSEIGGVYLRLMDDRFLPEVTAAGEGSTEWRRCRGLTETVLRWLEVAPCRVLNRVAPMASNSSKPYQAQLIGECGFSVPETLITNDPDRVLEFHRIHGRVIYKSTSGVRSIVRELKDEDFPRLEAIRRCPVMFQAYVPGTDIRVHVVGEEVFGTKITATNTDYRYAGLEGEEARLTACEVPGDLAEACVRLAAALELPFSGIDLRITPEGRAVCFEVNPSPAFSYYEANTGQPIARAVARYLAGEQGEAPGA